MRDQRWVWAAPGLLLLAACEPRPTAPPVPNDLFILRWLISGSAEEIFLGKDAGEQRLDADCGGALCPAGVDGDLLDVLLSDPFIVAPAVPGTQWADTVNLSLPDQGVVREIVTWTINRADTTLDLGAGRFDGCMEIVRRSDQEIGDASFFFAPMVGLVYCERRDDRFLKSADLLAVEILGNQTREGIVYADDFLPLAQGNQWSFELRGATESIQQSYRIH